MWQVSPDLVRCILDTLSLVETPAVVLTYGAFTEENSLQSVSWSRYQIERGQELQRAGGTDDMID